MRHEVAHDYDPDLLVEVARYVSAHYSEKHPDADVRCRKTGRRTFSLSFTVLGQRFDVLVRIERERVLAEADLPGALRIFEPLVRSSIEEDVREWFDRIDRGDFSDGRD